MSKLLPVTDSVTDIKFRITGERIEPQTSTFNVAFGMSDRHDSPDVVEDSDYGMLLPFLMKRGENNAFTYEMLDWEPCTKEYINRNFFPAEANDQRLVDFHLKKLKCLKMNGNPVDLFGDFDAVGSQYLSIFFSSCDLLNVATCADEAQVTEWLKHKYVLLYYTVDKPDDEVAGRSQSFSKFVHQPFNRVIDMNHRFKLHQQSYEGTDMYSVIRETD